jgi:hypothetical protein
MDEMENLPDEAAYQYWRLLSALIEDGTMEKHQYEAILLTAQ